MMKAIDLFAGLGGWTQGAKAAGVPVIWAANHWRSAVDFHSVNHRETHHECQELRQADWGLIPWHDLMLASPSCKGTTHARGKDKPRHDDERSTAWAVVDCAECHRQPVVVVEQVPAFLKWVLFGAWRMAMEALGYSVAPHIVDAADHGVPQNRVRAIIVCTRSKTPLWLELPKRPHVPFSQILAPDRYWSPVRTKCQRTRERVRAGRRQFGDRFLVPYYGSARTGRSLARPLGTVTTCERFAVVDGNRMGMLTVDEYRRAQSFPDSYVLPENKHLAVHLLGNAVPPVLAEDVIRALKAAA